MGFFGICGCKGSDVVESHAATTATVAQAPAGAANRPRGGPSGSQPPDSVVQQKQQQMQQKPQPQEAKVRSLALWNADHEKFKRIKFVVLTPQQQIRTGQSGPNLLFDLAPSVDHQTLQVKEITAKDCEVACLDGGDVLEYIGNDKLPKKIKPSAALKRIAKRTDNGDAKPCVLRFVSAEPSNWQRFNVVFYGGDIGMDLTGHGPEDIPVVTKVQDPASRLRSGDVLVAINGIDSVHLGFARSMEMIEGLKWKVLLTFHRVVTPRAIFSSRGAYRYSLEKETERQSKNAAGQEFASEWA